MSRVVDLKGGRIYNHLDMDIQDFYYTLPKRLIAQFPAKRRDRSRLLILNRKDGQIQHRHFFQIVEFLGPEDVMVINNTKVIPARLLGQKATGGRAELLILDGHRGRDGLWPCLIRGHRVRVGTRLLFSQGLKAEVREVKGEGVFLVEFDDSGRLPKVLSEAGLLPLPPYIKRDSPLPLDGERYQTVYAASEGAAAAPTAGLHFTRELLAQLEERGVTIVPISLHVSYGSFMPIRARRVEEHGVPEEWFQVGEDTAAVINRARALGKRLVAVGTTTVRALETAVEGGYVVPKEGYTGLYIYPGYRFKVVDAMITNFHLPGSSLILLVSAFAGRELILRAYGEAIRRGYRFLSYGDAMLIL